MDLVVVILILSVAIAIGIAIAPFILPVVGICIAIFIGCLLLRLIFKVARYGINELANIPFAMSSAINRHMDIFKTSLKMIYTKKLSTESNSLSRRVRGLLNVVTYISVISIWLVIAIVCVLLLLE